MIRHACTVALTIGCAAAIAEKPEGEQLLFATPPGWHEAYADRVDNLSTTEYVPDGETVDDWQEMLTVQVLVDKPKADPDAILSAAVKHLYSECETYAAQPIELGGVGDYPTLGVMSMCGSSKEDSDGRFILLRGIAGDENFYLLQKAWRTEPFNPDEEEPPVDLDQRKFWLGFLAFLRVCNPGAGNCPKAPSE